MKNKALLTLIFGVLSLGTAAASDAFLYLSGEYVVSSRFSTVWISVPTNVVKKVHEPMWIPYAAKSGRYGYFPDPDTAWINELVAASYNNDSVYTRPDKYCYSYVPRTSGLSWIWGWGSVSTVADIKGVYAGRCGDDYRRMSFFDVRAVGSDMGSCPDGEVPQTNSRRIQCGPPVDECAPERTRMVAVDNVTQLQRQSTNGNVCAVLELKQSEPSCTPAAGNSTRVGNPIDCATGQKRQTERDYQGRGVDALSQVRTFVSQGVATAGTPAFPEASGWRMTRVPALRHRTFADGSKLYQVSLGNGLVRNFFRSAESSGFTTSSGMSEVRLQTSEQGVGVTFGSGRELRFDAALAPESYRFPGGDERYRYTHTVVNGEPRLRRVQNRFGASLSYAYDDAGRLSHLTDQDGRRLHYRYDARGNLTDVLYPDDTPAYLEDNPRKTYLYEHPDWPRHLTGIVDQNGQRYATFGYDADGRAIRTEHADGAGRVEVRYPAGGEAIVRFYQDSGAGLYREEQYRYGRFRGTYRLTGKTVTVCQDCATGTETWDYNAEGLLERHTTPGGQVTEWRYDDRGRKLTETVAAGTPEARTTRYTWNDEWNRIQAVETGTEITAYVYDGRGHRIETTVTPKE